MVLSVPLQNRLTESRLGPLSLSVSTPAASASACPILGEGPLSSRSRDLLLEILSSPNRAIPYLRSQPEMRAQVVRLVASRGGSIEISTTEDEVGDVDRVLYQRFLDVWMELLTPAQAQVLSLMYFNGQAVSPSSVRDVSNGLGVSGQCVRQQKESIAQKAADLLTGRKNQAHRSTKESSRETQIRANLNILRKSVTEEESRMCEEVFGYLQSKMSVGSLKLLGVLDNKVSGFQLIQESSHDSEDIPAPFLVFCENNNLDLKVINDRVLPQSLMNLYLTLLNAACYEIKNYGQVRYAFKAIQKLAAMLTTR